MKVTILGTANAWGPNPFLPSGLHWPMTGSLSNGQQVQFRQFRTSLLVETADEKRILVDCGPDFSHQLRQFKVPPVDAIVLTHSHTDHIGGIDELNLYRPTGRFPIPAYATSACWNTIKNVRGLGYLIDNPASPTRGPMTEMTLLVAGQNPTFSVGSVKVTPFQVQHSQFSPGAVGFVFEETQKGQERSILYTGDLWAVSNPANPMFRTQFDVAIIECDRATGVAGPAAGGGHLSLDEIVRILTNGFLSNPRPSRVTLVHFGDNGPTPASTYADWRNAATTALAGIVPALGTSVQAADALIGYEGLVL
jgi:phosphoribosyl 1,2-cyclic phosphodiesterase